MTRLCYPLDIPRGARIVSHRGLGIDSLVVADVALWRTDTGTVVAASDASMRTVLLPPAERVEIDEDTPERRSRLAFAARVLSSEAFGAAR